MIKEKSAITPLCQTLCQKWIRICICPTLSIFSVEGGYSCTKSKITSVSVCIVIAVGNCIMLSSLFEYDL